MKTKNKFLAALFVVMFCFCALSNVLAASYDIKEMTPEVKAALDGRRMRFEQLKSFKSQGVIGENNKGYVEVLGLNGEAASVADAENKDRRFIYSTIVAQNGLPEGAISTVETVFAQVQRDKAGSGDKIQDESGNWSAK